MGLGQGSGLCSSSSRKYPVTELNFLHLPRKMEPIEGSETSAFKPQTPGKYPKENRLHKEHGKSLKSRQPVNRKLQNWLQPKVYSKHEQSVMTSPGSTVCIHQLKPADNTIKYSVEQKSECH